MLHVPVSVEGWRFFLLEGIKLEQRYPRSASLSVWSGAIAIVCILIVVLFLIPVYGSDVFLLSLAAALALLGVTFSFRFVPFYRVHGILLRKGEVGRKVTSVKQEMVRGLVILVATVIAAGSPILLMFILPPVEWFSVVIGAFLGVSCAEILFLMVIRLWERSTGISVHRYRIYSVVSGRRVLVEYGLRVSAKPMEK
jgi:hypothetical protein